MLKVHAVPREGGDEIDQWLREIQVIANFWRCAPDDFVTELAVLRLGRRGFARMTQGIAPWTRPGDGWEVAFQQRPNMERNDVIVFELGHIHGESSQQSRGAAVAILGAMAGQIPSFTEEPAIRDATIVLHRYLLNEATTDELLEAQARVHAEVVQVCRSGEAWEYAGRAYVSALLNPAIFYAPQVAQFASCALRLAWGAGSYYTPPREDWKDETKWRDDWDRRADELLTAALLTAFPTPWHFARSSGGRG